MGYPKPNYIRYIGRNYVNMTGSGKSVEIKVKEGIVITAPRNDSNLCYNTYEKDIFKNGYPMITSCSVFTYYGHRPFLDDYIKMFDGYDTIFFGKNLIIIVSNEESIVDNELVEYDENFVTYDDVKFINVTKSSIYLKDKNDHVIVVVPPSGVVIDASVRDVSSFDVGDCIVVKHEKRIEKWLKNIKGESLARLYLEIRQQQLHILNLFTTLLLLKVVNDKTFI